MEENQVIIASAVVVPEAQDSHESLSAGASVKRRQSSVAGNEVKRPRLTYEDGDTPSTDSHAQTEQSETRADRRRTGQAEERKRGQRLFGALLGTLSQSSSTSAQKRRAEIEKKQLAKLKLQAEEFDQKQKERIDKLMAIRKREQRKYDEQSMRISHSNLLAMAHFLHTQTEPKLYYKPWELRPEDQEKIQSQITQAEATIESELREFERMNEEAADSQSRIPGKGDADETNGISERGTSSLNGAADQTVTENGEHAIDSDQMSVRNENHEADHAEPNPEGQSIPVPAQEDIRDSADDTGEVVVEAEEDTLIY